jgi:F420-non-reducing hydrogenase small subunit
MKVCMLSLTCCAGCFLSLLSGGDDLYDFLTKEVEVVYSTTFMDTKEIPRVDLAIVEGGVKTEADENLLREIRAKSTKLVALGICATHGGVTSLGNRMSLKRLLESKIPMIKSVVLPELKDMIYPICTFVDVDYYVPGCPPMPDHIIKTLRSIVHGEEPERFKAVVCIECPRKILPVKPGKLFRTYEKEPDPEICLLSQGFICLGSLTRSGCGAPCPRIGFTCFGCRGPSDPLLYRSKDMFELLVSITSKRTGIPVEEVRKELYTNPFVFHTFIFSKSMERFKAKERVI